MNNMSISALIAAAQEGAVDFQTTMQVIDAHYDFTPTHFSNGTTQNPAGTNNGSCKLFAFALANELTPEATLNLFGDFYYQDVLQNPHGDDHQNIRNFMTHGFAGIEFSGQALRAK
ncbi:type III effector [Thiosulfatimonas sediminis]|uniref:Type III effector n=1 Tax=Thiosulfatimonas sediminis TaxID=2675054 RepID=A0A6F8PVE4_9GAMM|nr:HopJ type III effector protein [Thiosulfatimonas sediminis]BBP45940.1 type III effector [Thiosulfatimonas sediminis]